MKHQLKTSILTATLSLSSILALDITAQALPPVDTTVENSNSSTVPPVEKQ
ncbi:hypothetical protein MEO41_27605 [Dolichospermum sp. ST_sed4]|nr:hypothetical protein [Dolichospermum sp. ST_sed4]